MTLLIHCNVVSHAYVTFEYRHFANVTHILVFDVHEFDSAVPKPFVPTFFAYVLHVTLIPTSQYNTLVFLSKINRFSLYDTMCEVQLMASAVSHCCESATLLRMWKMVKSVCYKIFDRFISIKHNCIQPNIKQVITLAIPLQYGYGGNTFPRNTLQTPYWPLRGAGFQYPVLREVFARQN